MKIVISRYAGFCDGVDRAYKMVEKMSKDPKVKKPIAVLGSLVHNSDVVSRIESLGISKIDVGGDLEKTLKEAKKRFKTVVITAHGMGPKVYEIAKKIKLDLFDTTCPRVLKVQRLAKIFLDRMNQIVIVGDRDHKEVKGIAEWAKNKVFFVENEKDLKDLKLSPKKKIVVLSQTTQDQDFVNMAGSHISRRYKNVEVIDSICFSTHHRQTEIKNLASESDVVIVIGSPESANSTRLWEIAKKANGRSYFIEKAAQLKKEWLSKCKVLAVSAGASTPSWVIEEVIGKIVKTRKNSIVASTEGCEYSY